jgi:phage repressor protein C with HTH and peptisase S24 domain
MLREGRPVELVAQGTSMRPLFPPGATVRVWPARAEDVRVGDVVLVDVDGSLVAHRLIQARDGRIVTRGDSMPDADTPLPATAIVGRVEVPGGPLALYAAVRALLRC